MSLLAIPALPPPYQVDMDFVLARDPAQELNPQNPYGPDLDNLAKPVLDALVPSVLEGGDGAVLTLRLTKRRAIGTESTGVTVRIA